jgi:hypothetical protein
MDIHSSRYLYISIISKCFNSQMEVRTPQMGTCQSSSETAKIRMWKNQKMEKVGKTCFGSVSSAKAIAVSSGRGRRRQAEHRNTSSGDALAHRDEGGTHAAIILEGAIRGHKDTVVLIHRPRRAVSHFPAQRVRRGHTLHGQAVSRSFSSARLC